MTKLYTPPGFSLLSATRFMRLLPITMRIAGHTADTIEAARRNMKRRSWALIFGVPAFAAAARRACANRLSESNHTYHRAYRACGRQRYGGTRYRPGIIRALE